MRPPAPLLPPPPPPPPPPPGGGPARPAGPQLRALHWKKVQPSGKGTLWSSLPKAPPIDEAALRELFTVKAAGGQKPTAAPAGGGAGGSAVKKEQQPALLDVKRSNQIQIALAKFKGRGILAAVLALDETVLKQDDIARLRECSPSAEEVEMLSPFGEDPRLKETVRWGPAESFLLDMAAVPRLSQRLACFLSKLTFEQRKKDAEAQVEAINKAVQCLRGSKTLPLLLALVLQVGNALNAGTPRGAAAGFTSEALGKLAETKSTVSDARPAQTSLLHYVAR
uniref:FH2 domain-containing protein n=1 Tax=Emiliania huxleyi TaxID=2903 RepID=A0A6V2PDY2_EMIHU